jgi:hypothetical protein
MCLSLRLVAFAVDMASQVHDVAQVELLFDETDMAERYEATIQRTREINPWNQWLARRFGSTLAPSFRLN